MPPARRRYVLDARTATPHFPGIGRYVTSLAQALPPLLSANEELVLLVDGRSERGPMPAPDTGVHVRDVPVSPFSPGAQWRVPAVVRQLNGSLYHSPYYLMPYRPGAPAILTAFDLIPLLLPEDGSARARLFFRFAMRLALRRARAVITTSHSTERDLRAAFGVRRGLVSVIPAAADPIFRVLPRSELEAWRAAHDLPPSYALYFGSNKPHKNLELLVRAWSAYCAAGGRETLVIAGHWDARYPAAQRLAGALGLGEQLLFLGPVTDAEAPYLYNGASLFLWPSRYEGFGLPVLEAMACGVPVISSNASSLPEVAGEAARLLPPQDPAAWAEAAARILRDRPLAREMRERGLEQAARFSWERSAAATLELYRAVAGGAG